MELHLKSALSMLLVLMTTPFMLAGGGDPLLGHLISRAVFTPVILLFWISHFLS